MDVRQVLIAAPPGKLQEGLQILLGTLPQARVLVITEGETTRKAVKAHPFDLVILDSALPPVGALELIRHLHAASGSTRYLVLADRAGEVAPLRATGANAVRVKGYPAAQLLKLITQLLEDNHE